ncbi:hypothetical protein BDY19DRAFT_190179 [Irpex rosettiformis]|uniref:Uncharacterized protein n=1 Tax=Irpex rosettiformis TaxID=378272 RepID=A0ACB8U255_9APHY|nr:hypothetical protein BDY19DRAFT_190179 [Irpex rosettiformis]
MAPIPVPPPPEAPSPHAPSFMSSRLSRRTSATASLPLSEEEPAPEPSVLPPQSPPPTVPEDLEDVQTIAQSLHHSVLDATSRHSQDMLETLRLEREEMHRQLDEERAERERRNAELAAIRDQREADLMERVRLLEERLATTEAAHEQTKADLEQERQLRITEETERRESERAEDRQRADDAMLQLSELTNVATETRDELARKREVSDERWSQKEVWKEQKDRDMVEMKDMLSNMQRMFEESERRREEEKAVEAAKPSIESIVEDLRRENGELRELFKELTENLRQDHRQNIESILDAVRSTAQEQVPFNISGYLDEFSRTLAKEVRQLLTEVNELVENKTRLQFEIATLLEFKARYEPGGFFWKQGSQMPSAPPAPAAPAEAPPAEHQPPPEPAQAPPAWRTMRPRRGRRAREQAAAAAAPAPPPAAQHMAPPPMMQMDPSRSWPLPWQPSQSYIPSPSSQVVEPLPAPPPQDTRPMGLFGPRTPHESYLE